MRDANEAITKRVYFKHTNSMNDRRGIQFSPFVSLSSLLLEMQICFECKKIRENVIVSFWRKNRHLFFKTVNRYYFDLEWAKKDYEFNSHFKRLEWILISTSEFQKMFIYQATLQYVVLYLDVLCTYQDYWRVSQKESPKGHSKPLWISKFNVLKWTHCKTVVVVLLAVSMKIERILLI